MAGVGMIVTAWPSPAQVRVVEHRRTIGEIDQCSVELGDDAGCAVALYGTLRDLVVVMTQVTEGLVEIEAARRGPEGMAE